MDRKKMTVESCVRSGECCIASPCAFGGWNSDESKCKYLVGDGPGSYGCGIYDEIIKDPSSDLSPAFGAGCCRNLFNESRAAVINDRYGGVIPTHEIEVS